jgi:hypothetical protein
MWATAVVAESLSLDFLGYQGQLMAVRENYDPGCFASFVNSLDKGGHLKRIRDQRLSLLVSPLTATVITSQGVRDGRMTWGMEAPLLISVQNSQGVVASQKILAEILVERAVPRGRNGMGVVIKRLQLKNLGQA